VRALRLLALVVAIGVGCALGAIALLVVFQRRLLYQPTRESEPAALARAARLRLVPWRGAAGAFLGWRADAVARPRARVLVLHGNGGAALDRAQLVEALAPHGLDVVLLEYPGYGPRPGEPSLATLTRAAADALELLAAEGAPVWLLGESLGSGVAGRAFAERPALVAGLLLVTPFADLATVARARFPLVPRMLLRDRYAPARDLATFDGPAVVLVAGKDDVVTADEGRRLFAALRGPKQLYEQPDATHNTLDLDAEGALWGEIVSFLASPAER
jgi:pimeloyl-ACP methyl ester carboxylesterase